MSIDSILTALPRFLKPSVLDTPEASELNPLDLITIDSAILADYGDGVLIGIVTAHDPEPDEWGDVWFFVKGVLHNHCTGKMSLQSAWLLRSSVIEVIEL